MKVSRLFLAAILLAATPILAQGQEKKKLPIPAGKTIQKGEIYVSPSGNHELVLAKDGNLIIQRKDGSYVWGLDRLPGLVDKGFKLERIARVGMLKDGFIGLYDDKQNLISTFGGTKKDNSMLTVSFNGALQVVNGDQILWASDDNLTPPIKVGLLKADIEEATAELAAHPGWHQCWKMKDPTIKIFVTKTVSKEALNAVANILAEMTKRLDPNLDPNPKDRFNDFKVYLTNNESGEELKKLSGVNTFWVDGSSQVAPQGRDFFLGGARKKELWICEQMICKTGVKIRASLGIKDTETRTFDQVVHEFAHSIDMTFDLQKKNNIATVFNGSMGPAEGFAWGVQYWFGTPGGKPSDDQKSRLSGIFVSRVSFSSQGYGTPIADIKVGVADNIAKIQSLPSDKKLNVVWTNKTSGPVTVNWIDFKGIETPSKTPIQPGASFSGDTFVNHYFRVRDANGVAIRVIKVETTSAKLDILK